MTDRAAEREELTFLVGNACSRVINLLMQPDVQEDALREELAFLADKSGRLAALLAQSVDSEEENTGP